MTVVSYLLSLPLSRPRLRGPAHPADPPAVPDLDLDHFCELISAELREIVAHPTQTFEFVFSEENQPFGPDDTRSAVEILQDSAGVKGFHRTLAKHFFDRSSLRVGEGKGAKTRRAVEVFSV